MKSTVPARRSRPDRPRESTPASMAETPAPDRRHTVGRADPGPESFADDLLKAIGGPPLRSAEASV